MIHILTIHFGTDRWIAPQLERLQRHTTEPYETWVTVSAATRPADEFDHVFPSRGPITADLDFLASEAARHAAPDDLLVFLDGDAFPVADWTERVRGWLAERPLVAVRRDENLGDPQPAHLFCACTAGFWKELGGTWADGPIWSTTTGVPVTDHGAQLWRLLIAREIEWHPILRSNQVDLHPVWFGVYGDLIYHHGAAFRPPACRWDGAQYAHLPGPLGRAARWRQGRATARLSAQLADRIAAGDDPIDELRGLTPTRSRSAVP